MPWCPREETAEVTRGAAMPVSVRARGDRQRQAMGDIEGSGEDQEEDQDHMAAMTKAPFCPPKPKLVDKPYFTRPSRATLGM